MRTINTGQKLRGLRGNMNQSKVAKEIGISARTLGLLETNQRDCKFKLMCKIADYYNVSVSDLRDDED